MNYTSFEDMANTIRCNLWKIPTDVSLIVGVPRSGMMAALMVGEFLHKPVIDLQGYLDGRAPYAGSRGRHMANAVCGRVLVLDDTVYSGRSINAVKEKFAANSNTLFGCVYAEGRDAKNFVDLYLEDNYDPNDKPWHLYEWNILHHGEKMSMRTMWDLDGVLCLDPPDERHREEYEDYIQHARPMVRPTTPLGAIVTYRLEKYRAVTERWLKSHEIAYERLIMHPEPCYVRDNDCAATYKAMEYDRARWALLFVESNEAQAKAIARMAHKPVFCYANGQTYYK